MSIKKNYPANSEKCRVTFKLTKEMAQGTSVAYLAGDFNEWNTEASPMRQLKDGSFSTTISLEKGSYQFRYYLGGGKWVNEPESDHAVPTQFMDAENSVIVI